MRYTYAADLQATNAPKLWTSKNERRQYDDFASLYAMITAIDKIEKAYMNSAIASAAYDASCSELIAKFKTLRTVTEDSVPDVQHFMGHIYDALQFSSASTTSWGTCHC